MKKTKRRKRRNPARFCEYCNAKAARKVILNHTFGRGAKMVIVANVETIVCDNCGQHYVEGDALRTLNHILASPEAYAQVRMVPVADFSLV
jgi:YgiT-type zinc finger domain-containing protein